MKKLSMILAASALLAVASSANAAYSISGSGVTTLDSDGVTEVAWQTITSGTGTLTTDGGGAFESFEFTMTFDVLTLLGGTGTINSTTSFDDLGAALVTINTCTGDALICGASGAGLGTFPGMVNDLNFSDLDNITWTSSTPKLALGNPAHVNMSLTATSAVPVPAAAWLFGSALVGLAGIGRKRKAA